MKKFLMSLLVFTSFSLCACAHSNPDTKNMKTIKLNSPDLNRGANIMQALSKRQSTKSASDRELSLQDLSDVLWAANGINRPESGKRTAPSAMNRQDVKVYVCTKEGSYLYDHKEHALVPVSSGDVRPTDFPVVLVLVTDSDSAWAAMDAGIVSQNISLFCAGAGLATYPRASMNDNVLRKALALKGDQTLMLCNPVGYPK